MRREGDLEGALCTGRIRAARPTSQARLRPVCNASGKSGLNAQDYVHPSPVTVLPRR